MSSCHFYGTTSGLKNNPDVGKSGTMIIPVFGCKDIKEYTNLTYALKYSTLDMMQADSFKTRYIVTQPNLAQLIPNYIQVEQ